MAATIWSASACFTRGSFAPCAMSSGSRNPVHEGQRRAILEELAPVIRARVADAASHILEERLPIRRNGSDQRREVRRPDNIHATGKPIRRKRQTHERRIAAIRATIDGNLLGHRDLLSTAQSTASNRSLCILPAHSWSPALMKLFPNPVEPR